MRSQPVFAMAALLLSTLGSSQETPTAAKRSADGPFGLVAGLSQADVIALVGADLEKTPQQPMVFKLPRAPKPHSMFESYYVVLTPNAGLCKVFAVGRDISTSSHGVEVRDDFNKIETLLTNVYGTGRKVEHLRPGSIWAEPQDWMMGLLKKERVLQAIWSSETGASLKNGVRAVNLKAAAQATDRGYLSLGYEFENFGVCQKELQEGEKSVF